VDIPPAARGNVVTVALATGAVLDEERTLRSGLVSSGCGICGKATLESIAVLAPPVSDGPVVNRELLDSLPRQLRAGQSVFAVTGGLHAAGLFTADGKLLCLREDIGRHNAVDKVIGEAMRFGRLPLSETVLLVSGRAGFEIVHKARMAGIPIICSVSAPSSLSIALAQDGNQTLIGFLRDGRCNVYCGTVRLAP
jgi:FdhD protein